MENSVPVDVTYVVQMRNAKLTHKLTQALQSYWELVLCPKAIGSEIFDLKCLLGDCQSCGPAKKLPICPMEDSDSVQVKVKIFEDIQIGQTETSKKKKRKVLSHKEMSSRKLLDLFRGHLSKFIKHNWVYRWQAEQFKECLRIFPDDMVVLVVDFAENYTSKEQNEIQSMHWFSSQVYNICPHHVCANCRECPQVLSLLYF